MMGLRLVLIVALGSLLAQDQSPAQHHLGFHFIRGDCLPTQAYCAARVPRDWTAEDLSNTRRALDEIVATDIGRRLVRVAQDADYVTLRRYERGAIVSNGQVVVRDTLDAQIPNSVGVQAIDFNDRIFRQVGLRDEFSGTPGYALFTKIILHELFHVLDRGGRFSETDEFASLVGFQRGPTGQWRYVVETSAELKAFETAGTRLKQLAATGDHAAIWRHSRGFSLLVAKRNMPSIVATINPAEAFAEIGAHMVLDPNAPQYISSRVQDYVRQCVNR